MKLFVRVVAFLFALAVGRDAFSMGPNEVLYTPFGDNITWNAGGTNYRFQGSSALVVNTNPSTLWFRMYGLSGPRKDKSDWLQFPTAGSNPPVKSYNKFCDAIVSPNFIAILPFDDQGTLRFRTIGETDLGCYGWSGNYRPMGNSGNRGIMLRDSAGKDYVFVIKTANSSNGCVNPTIAPVCHTKPSGDNGPGGVGELLIMEYPNGGF